ncbi:MAG: exosome complex protein Rrp4 [Candidatus Pacearchaeota archaeon]|nr:exosome complex protein Rrp4 [Candidatus Pacearchaeota archaeon]
MTEKKETREEKKEKETKLEERSAEENKEKERIVVVPGEVIASGSGFLPGEGTRREGQDIVAARFGLFEKTDKIVKVIPLSGVYIPRVGNTVIGQVIDVTFNGWIVDILAPHLGFLSVTECGGYVNKKDLTEYYTFKDALVAKIKAIKARGIDLTMREKGLRKLEGGMLIKINPTRVPRVIGREGSMINIIKDETGCNIIVGQNGVIWIKGRNVEGEILAKKAIELIARKPFIEGLTEKVKEFLHKERKSENKEAYEVKERGERKERKKN